MKDFEIYSFFLDLMNRGVSGYSIPHASKELGADEDDVEEVSRILEEYGIVKSRDAQNYVFVGGIELMRKIFTNKKSMDSTEKQEAYSEKIGLADITNTKWVLHKVEETERKDSGKRKKSTSFFDSIFGVDDDDDDDDDNGFGRKKHFENSRKKREQRQAFITSFIEKKENYDPIASSFSSHVQILYPDGTPFVFQYIVKDGAEFFTDNGLMKAQLASLTKNLPEDIMCGWIDDELDELADDSALTYEDGVLYSNLDSSYTSDHLNGEISYFVKIFEQFFTGFYEKFKDRELNEIQEFIISRKVDDFLTSTCNLELSEDAEKIDDSVIDLLMKIAMLNEDIKRSHALNIAEQLVSISKNENGNKNHVVFENLLQKIQTLSDMEFKIFQNAIESVLK